jgi:hypothetical protein
MTTPTPPQQPTPTSAPTTPVAPGTGLFRRMPVGGTAYLRPLGDETEVNVPTKGGESGN